MARWMAMAMAAVLAAGCAPDGGTADGSGAAQAPQAGASYVPTEVEGWEYAPPRPDGSPGGLWQMRASGEAGGEVQRQYDAVSEGARAVRTEMRDMPEWDGSEPATWRRAVRERLPVPAPFDGELAVRVHDVTQVDGVRVESVDFTIATGLRARGALLVPEQVTPGAPAVLFFHGHGISPLEAVLGAPGDELDAYQRGAALAIAQQGHVVFAPEIRSFGASGRFDFAMHEYYVHLVALAGRSALGDFVADGLRALEVLRSRPEVGDAPVVTAGISLGGEVAWLVAALDESVDGAYVAGALGALGDVALSGPQCSCQYPQNLASAWDVDMLAAMTAPRPVWFSVGEGDLVLAPATERGAERIALAPYTEAGAEGAVQVSRHAGAHVFDAEDFDAFATWFAAQ